MNFHKYKYIFIAVIIIAFVSSVFLFKNSFARGIEKSSIVAARVNSITLSASQSQNTITALIEIIKGETATNISIDDLPLASSPNEMNRNIKKSLEKQGFLSKGDKLILFGGAMK